MGFRDVYWYKEGIAGWKTNNNFLESSDFTYATRKIPDPITAKELRSKLKTDDLYVLVDIRDEKSRKKMGSIKGPTFVIPLYRMHLDVQNLPTDKILVVYDIGGNQSPPAIRFLMKNRFYFTNLSYLKGGMTAWEDQELPMTDTTE